MNIIERKVFVFLLFWGEKEKGYCFGTSEREPCLCEGDQTKCEFGIAKTSILKREETEPVNNMIDKIEKIIKEYMRISSEPYDARSIAWQIVKELKEDEGEDIYVEL